MLLKGRTVIGEKNSDLITAVRRKQKARTRIGQKAGERVSVAVKGLVPGSFFPGYKWFQIAVGKSAGGKLRKLGRQLHQFSAGLLRMVAVNQTRQQILTAKGGHGIDLVLVDLSRMV